MIRYSGYVLTKDSTFPKAVLLRMLEYAEESFRDNPGVSQFHSTGQSLCSDPSLQFQRLDTNGSSSITYALVVHRTCAANHAPYHVLILQEHGTPQIYFFVNSAP